MKASEIFTPETITEIRQFCRYWGATRLWIYDIEEGVWPDSWINKVEWSVPK